MHATLQVAAVLYIEALEMQLVSMYVCVCVLAPCVYGGGGVKKVVTLCLCMGGGGGGGGVCYSSHFVCAYGEGVQTGCF